MLLSVLLYHIDHFHQLRQVGLILIVLRLFKVRGCEIIERGCSVESIAPVWVLSPCRPGYPRG